MRRSAIILIPKPNANRTLPRFPLSQLAEVFPAAELPQFGWLFIGHPDPEGGLSSTIRAATLTGTVAQLDEATSLLGFVPGEDDWLRQCLIKAGYTLREPS